jgi:RHH-type transcriptional regulator, proline utilization regulon repressor / proline dehydrogenase / delta 1-pyrroline-5-carboxylate dehydrogenase
LGELFIQGFAMITPTEDHRSLDHRTRIREANLEDEAGAIRRLVALADLQSDLRAHISRDAASLVQAIRDDGEPGLMEQFLGEYGLSTTEGVALMCLAEALLRVPDAKTIDALIQDKIAPANWGQHLGHSSSSLVNASTWGLLLTGQVLKEEKEPGLVATLRDVVRRLGEPVVRTAVSRAMREMGQQFVLGQDMSAAMKRASDMERRGYTYSYDMLGEAARTEDDARRYHLSYADAIGSIARACPHDDLRLNPGISVKLSALHPRYEWGQRERVAPEITARLGALLTLAKSANMGLNIDAEEADRLDLSLDIIEAALASPALADWDGFGVVVQAYGKRAAHVLDWLYALAERLDRRIMVRLVKGAYWDTEIKRAQVLGIDGFPVFTRKVNTDVSYIACARKLLGMTDRIYPQFATHNAHTVAAVVAMGADPGSYEFQRLHGMGEALHQTARQRYDTRCRIYAPVGAHEDLLAYLVRRLLENGANSSFVNQIVDEGVSPEEITADPFDVVTGLGEQIAHPRIAPPPLLFGTGRRNARGWDLTDPVVVEALEQNRNRFRDHQWSAAPVIAGLEASTGPVRNIINPANKSDIVGSVRDATPEDVDAAYSSAVEAQLVWAEKPATARADILRLVADAYEDNAAELMALATREAGKTLADGIAEVREAVDFLRFYANEAERIEAEEPGHALGVFACISPWNFPLAIFTGPIAAAIACGNAVVAKPAEQTCLIAGRAVELMIEAGIPKGVIQFLPGDGPGVGQPLVSDPRLAGVCFTGSTDTAQAINRTMAEKAHPTAPLIAETGGLNAMILDSTALAEQGVRDVVASAFQSAGQRCSATRILYIQKDVEERTLRMLKGAMETLQIGEPWLLSSDVGPVIDDEAYRTLSNYVTANEKAGNLIARLPVPEGLGGGNYVAPVIVRTEGIGAMAQEMFGPILHVATFEADELDDVVAAINARNFGLTLGIHTRVDQRVQDIVSKAHVGNIYVNRNQIGAVVNSQPFGGEGLSGTGPKAGGPLYIRRFRRSFPDIAPNVALEEIDLPGPTGESNRYLIKPRGRVVCLGDLAVPGSSAVLDRQKTSARSYGNEVLVNVSVDALTNLKGVDSVIAEGDENSLRSVRQALAVRTGQIIPLLASPEDVCGLVSERTLCIDTTAAGGNASLLAEVSD